MSFVSLPMGDLPSDALRDPKGLDSTSSVGKAYLIDAGTREPSQDSELVA